MSSSSHVQFTFGPHVPMGEAEGTFRLALMAAESLHGRERVDMEARYSIDPLTRTIEVDRSSDAGSTLALVYLGYARREFGADAVRMRRVDLPAPVATGASR